MSDVVTLLPAGTGSNVTGSSIDAGDLKDEAAIEVIPSGASSAMSVQLQGSIDGANWFNIGSAYTSLLATPGEVAATGFVARYFRAVTGTITGATVTVELGFAKN